MVGNARYAGSGVVDRQVPDRAQLVGQRPDDVAGLRLVVTAALTLALSRRERGQCFIGHKLIHRVRLPEITVREVRSR